MLRLIAHGFVSLALPGHALSLAGRTALAVVAMVLALAAQVFLAAEVWLIVAYVAVCVLAALAGVWFLRGVRESHKPLAAITGSAYPIVLFLVLVISSRNFRVPAASMAPTFNPGEVIRASRFGRIGRDLGRGDVIVFEWPCNRERDYLKRIVGMPGDTVAVSCGQLWLNGARVPTTQLSERETVGDAGAPEHVVARYREELGGRSHEIFVELEDGIADYPDELAGTCADQIDSDGSGGVRMTVVPSNLPAGDCTPTQVAVVPPGHIFAMGDNRDNSNDSRQWGAVPIDNITAYPFALVWPLSRLAEIP